MPSTSAPARPVAPAPNELQFSEVRIRKTVIEALIRRGFNDDKTKVTNEVLVLMEWAVRTHILELLARSANQCKLENSGSELEVRPSHVEHILAQAMFDL